MKILQEGNSLLMRRFRQLLWATQIAAACGVLNLTFFASKLSVVESILNPRLDTIALLLGIVATFLVFSPMSRGKYQQGMTVFLWIWSAVMIVVIWAEGGLYSSIMATLPILFIFAALVTELLVFLSISFVLILAVVLMGLNHSFGWYLPSPDMFIEGTPRVISTIVVNVISGYTAWVFAGLLKHSFEQLTQENERVIQSQATIKKLAESDVLTGLLNRNAANISYEQMLLNTDLNQQRIVAYFLDLDNFKRVNDLFNHQEGDRLLQTISQRLKVLSLQNGFVCRLGGDEFILFTGVDASADLNVLANHLMQLLTQSHYILDTEVEITVSVGIVVVSDLRLSFDDVCKKADMAMYKAKQSGKNKYHYYSEKLEREYMKNANIINGLSDAVSYDLLDLYFQPKVNLTTNTIGCAEALLRWNRGNPEGFRPDEFIPVIESTELIHEIGAWVIEQACVTCKQWHDDGYIMKLAVNVSAVQLLRPNFCQIVVAALAKSQLQSKFLEIELTEHSLLQESHEVSRQLALLKETGISLAIDDFGTGYSNMSYLTRLQVGVLKLDRSFISEITTSREHLVIVTAIIQMANILDMKVIAEGVETEQEKDLLIRLGCDYGQGYLWSPAVANADFICLLNGFVRSGQLIVSMR